MFGFLTRTVTKPDKLKTKPTESNSFQEYQALATKLNTVHSTRLKSQSMSFQIVDFLWENDIEIYDHAHVERYLTQMGRRMGKDLVWRGLREADRSRYESYNRPVPVEILRNVDLILTKFPTSDLCFEVSDFAVPNPDPFIRVSVGRYGGETPIVFGVWDEPGYSIEKQV